LNDPDEQEEEERGTKRKRHNTAHIYIVSIEDLYGHFIILEINSFIVSINCIINYLINGNWSCWKKRTKESSSLVQSSERILNNRDLFLLSSEFSNKPLLKCPYLFYKVPHTSTRFNYNLSWNRQENLCITDSSLEAPLNQVLAVGEMLQILEGETSSPLLILKVLNKKCYHKDIYINVVVSNRNLSFPQIMTSECRSFENK